MNTIYNYLHILRPKYREQFEAPFHLDKLLVYLYRVLGSTKTIFDEIDWQKAYLQLIANGH